MVVIWYYLCLVLSQTCSWAFGNYLDNIYLCNHHFHGWGTTFFRFLRKRCPDLRKSRIWEQNLRFCKNNRFLAEFHHTRFLSLLRKQSSSRVYVGLWMPKGNRPVLTTARLALRRFSGIPRRFWRPLIPFPGRLSRPSSPLPGPPRMGWFSADCPYSVDAKMVPR